MFDATGKPDSGMFIGNTVWLGSFSECMAVEATANGTKLFDGQFCVAVFANKKTIVSSFEDVRLSFHISSIEVTG